MQKNQNYLTLLSLQGLSVGDAFGETLFDRKFLPKIRERALLPSPRRYTDDTCQAFSVVDMLLQNRKVDQDLFAKMLARRFDEDPYRGYGLGAIDILSRIFTGLHWKKAALRAFPDGSYGNGAAMRIAPLGAYFYEDLDRVVKGARLTSVVTHAHSEGQAGSTAIAAAAALICRHEGISGNDLINEVFKLTPPSKVAMGIEDALDITENEPDRAAHELGTGRKVSCQDTVPFCIWCVARKGKNFEDALWTSVSKQGDLDTIGAMVGALSALSCGAVPEEWLNRREPLPDEFQQLMVKNGVAGDGSNCNQ